MGIYHQVLHTRQTNHPMAIHKVRVPLAREDDFSDEITDYLHEYP